MCQDPRPVPPGPGASWELLRLLLSSPQKVGAGLGEMERQIRKSRTSLEKDVKALSELLARLGKETPRPHESLASSCEAQSWGSFSLVSAGPPIPSLRVRPKHHPCSRSPCARQGWCPGARSPCASGAPCQVEGGETEQSPPAPVGTRSAGPPSAVEGFRGERTLQKQAWGQGSRAGLESDRLRFKSGTFRPWL